MSKHHTLVLLRAEYAELIRLERFIDKIPWLESSGKFRAIIVASELFDNIVSHGRHVWMDRVVLKISSGPILRIYYRSSNLDDFKKALANQYEQKNLKTKKLHYNEQSKRYTGLGLGMIARLGSRVHIQEGLFWHRISVVC